MNRVTAVNSVLHGDQATHQTRANTSLIRKSQLFGKQWRLGSGWEAPHLEARSVAELGVVVGAASAHISHRVGEGPRGAAHPRGRGVGKGPSRGFWKEAAFACAASRARSGWSCKTELDAGRTREDRDRRTRRSPLRIRLDVRLPVSVCLPS